jgi:transcriptional regulator with XRE-family HTH domain
VGNADILRRRIDEMKAQVKHRTRTAKEPAATFDRNFRTFLLMQQFAAEEIGARIAEARKLRGLTQEELAEMASFSKRSLQDYETGVTIPYRHVRELSRLLRKPEEWFLYGDQENDEAPLAELLENLGDVAGLLRSTAEELREELRLQRARRAGPPAEAEQS